MKKWKIAGAAAVSVALIACNIYLIEKKDSKVERTVFVEEWAQVKKDTITETFQTKGVVAPMEDYDVYFEPNQGEFQKFLVKEGEEVSVGTSLFEYTTAEKDVLRENLEAEKSAVEGEIKGIDEYINKLKAYQEKVDLGAENSALDDSVTEDLTINNTQSSATLIKSNIEQEIYKKELEKNSLDEQAAKIDQQLSSIDDQTNGVETASPADGVVKKIHTNLVNPIITIASKEVGIEGKFAQDEIIKTKVGMKIEVSSPDMDDSLNGTIERIHAYPDEEPNLDSENHFPFKAAIEKTDEGGDEEPLTTGKKVEITVITDEKAGVKAVPAAAIHQKKLPYVYEMTNKGYIDKQYVKKGIKAQGKQELIDGSEVGNIVLLNPGKVVKNHSPFITPLQVDRIEEGSFKTFTKREKARYILLGWLEK